MVPFRGFYQVPPDIVFESLYFWHLDFHLSHITRDLFTPFEPCEECLLRFQGYENNQCFARES
jgi:hypothetical protein